MCVGFNLPLVLKRNETRLEIVPSTWKSLEVKGDEAELFDPVSIVRMYYITAALSVRFCLFIVSVFIIVSALGQTARGIKWSKEGNSYYVVEDNNLVKYQPSFNRTMIIDSQKLVPHAREDHCGFATFPLAGVKKCS